MVLPVSVEASAVAEAAARGTVPEEAPAAKEVTKVGAAVEVPAGEEASLTPFVLQELWVDGAPASLRWLASP